jgi:hypothetical protein
MFPQETFEFSIDLTSKKPIFQGVSTFIAWSLCHTFLPIKPFIRGRTKENRMTNGFRVLKYRVARKYVTKLLLQMYKT